MNQPIVLFEDESLMVIEKPAGFIVNRADTAKDQATIQEWIEKKFGLQNKIDTTDKTEFESRAGIVHRLDKETSGLLIIAKTEQAFIALQKMFKEGLVSKEYIALAHGIVRPQSGEINVPIGRLPWNRMRFGILPGGRESRTLYKVLKTYEHTAQNRTEELSLVEVYPRTGRTHQIRVHFQYIGFPLFSDSLYAGRKSIKRDRKILPRHFLHAQKISFPHPVTGERLEFKSEMPQELQEFVSQLSEKEITI